jgi:RNA polymerase sigma-70 factor, ECF subfamily
MSAARMDIMQDQIPDNTVPSPGEATRLLIAWSAGDRTALDRLIPLILSDLQRRARYILRGLPSGHTLQPDSLVNEAFIKLVGHPERAWNNRAHFLAVAARAMRQILIDHARSRMCSSRSGKWKRLPEDQARLVPSEDSDDLVALEDALRKLGEVHARARAVVELRCFVGATIEEIAEALNISRITVLRDWKTATDFLRQEMLTAEE